jgi:hypothetical protein
MGCARMAFSKEVARIEERQVKYWDIYRELQLRAQVEIRRGWGVYHIVPLENREIKAGVTARRALLLRQWPLCGKQKSLENHATEPVPEIHTLCSICARAAHACLSKLDAEPKDE